jgi:uncharacterized protein YndB with AHSA1/START domain
MRWTDMWRALPMGADDLDLGEVSETAEGATVVFERRPCSVVWRALTEPAQLAAWLDDATVDLRVGGTLAIRFRDGTMNGVITELEDERVLAYSWHEDRHDRSHVRWELADSDGGTLVRMTHSRLRHESAAGFAAGWHHHLELLSALLDEAPVPWDAKRFEALHALYSGRL